MTKFLSDRAIYETVIRDAVPPARCPHSRQPSTTTRVLTMTPEGLDQP